MDQAFSKSSERVCEAARPSSTALKSVLSLLCILAYATRLREQLTLKDTACHDPCNNLSHGPQHRLWHLSRADVQEAR